MNIFLLDKNLIVCNVLSSEGDVNSSPFFNDVYTQYLETGAETFEFETLQSDYLEIGNYVAFQHKGEFKLFQIIEVTDEHESSLTKGVYCETAGLELNYEVLRPREIASASIGQYLENVLSETDWELGNVDDNVADVYTINIENYETVYDDIQERIKLYDCEIAFRVEIKNNKVVGKYIDVYKKRGSVTNYRFEYGVNLEGVVRKVNASELVTALIGVGKDGESIKKAEWKKSDGDPVDKPVNQDFVEDEEAFNLYNNNGSHLMGYYECDLESPYDILEATYKELKKRSTPKIEYEIESSIFDMEECGIGDEVYVIDNTFTPNPLHLSARVNEVQLSFTDEMKNKIKFANYKNVKSKITDEMRNIANTLDRIESNTTYGISRGGFLNSELITNGFDILVKNKYLNSRGESYYLDIRKKNATDFMVNKTNSIGTITQSFAIDFVDNHVYAIQLEDNNTTGNLVLSKMDYNGSILGKMYLKAFGHGNQIGLDRVDGEVKIWVECDGSVASGGSFVGHKICRFKFENGVTHKYHAGNVYDLAPTDSTYVTVAVNEESDRLTIRYKSSNGKFYYSTYSLNSILTNNPRLISNIQLPSDFSTTKAPNQGFAVLENYIYSYQGFGYDRTNNQNNTKISVISLKGDVIYSHLVNHARGLSHREPEGLFIKKSDTNVELYFGFASGTSGSRKINIYKYSDVISSDYELKGKFIHNNGHTSFIDECVINTKLDGSLRRSSFLIYTDTLQPNFAIARVKNGQLYVNNLVYTPSINDAIIAEIQETLKGISLNVLTTDIELLNGQDGKTSYTWVKYSDNKMGSPMYDEPQDSLGNFRKYMGISYDNESPQEGTNPNDYTWIKVVGEDGLDGDNPLIANLTNDTHSVPTDSDGNNGNYSGCYSKIELFKGEEKITSNVIYSYSASSGVTGSWNSTEGMYTVTNMTVEAGYVDLIASYGGKSYTKRFTIIKNKQGKDAYTINMSNDSHAFSAESNGNITSIIKTTTVVTAFKGTTSVTPSIGTLPTVTGLTLSKSGTTITIQANTGTSLADSGSFDIPITVDGRSFVRTFSWVKVKKGSDGTSVTTVDVEYAQSQSSTEIPISGWTTTAPTWVNGKYIWSRTKTILSTGGVNYTNPVCITGQQGNNGTGIESITEEYYLSTSKTTQTGGSWVTTPPTWSTGKYMWTRSKIVYKNPTSTVYTPAVCDTSWEAVNELEIGGRNYWRWSSGCQFKNIEGIKSKWYSGRGDLTLRNDVMPYGIGLEIPSTSTTSAYCAVTITAERTISIPKGTQVTLSMNMFVGTNSKGYAIRAFNQDDKEASQTYIVGGTITPNNNKLVCTFSMPYDNTNFYIYNEGVKSSSNSISSTIVFTDIMLEKGNKNSDWIMAKEDTESSINDVSNALSTLDKGIKDAFGDGIINDSEAKAIGSNIQVLDLEKADVDKEYTTVYSNSKLNGNAKTNLYNAKVNYDSAHTSLKSAINNAIADKVITDSERTSVNSFFSTYGTRKSEYRQRLQEALDYISTAKVDDVEVGGRNLVISSNNETTYNKDYCIQISKDGEFIKVVKTINDVNSHFGVWKDVEVESETTYTVSFKVDFSDGGRLGIGSFISGNSLWSQYGYHDFSPNSIFTKTFTTLENETKIRLFIALSQSKPINTYFKFKNLKLERGNKATDYTPAQEDIDGAIGKNINTVDVMYYLSTSQTSLVGGSWSTTAPTWVNGKYMWSKTVTTLANGTVKESSPTCIAGAKGDTGKGVKSIVEQYYLSTSSTSLKGGSWSTTAPTWQQGKYIWTRSVITYTDGSTTTTNAICVSGSKGDKGDKGDVGSNGANGTSPILLTISGQQSMKYLESNTPPVPSTSTLTADLSEGNTIVSSNVSYLWQYKNSSGSWGNLSGTNNAKTYSLSYTNGAFVSDVAQIRVAATYKSKTYYTEFTVTKIYDNKYITQEEIFNKLTNNGQEQGIYKQDGKIYLNMTYAKTGQLIADLIRGGVLTLGGESNSDGVPINGYMRVLGADNQELAVLDGGDMTINGLSSNEAIIDTLYVNDIKSPKITDAVTEPTTIYVDKALGNDDVLFDNGAVYKSIQGAIDSIPKNLNGYDVNIRVKGTSSGGVNIHYENLYIKGFYGGSFYLFLQKNYVHGYISMRDCSARLAIIGGSSTGEIPDGLNSNERANIKPSTLFTTGNTNYSICAINCTDVYIRSLDVWGSVATNTNGYPNYVLGSREGSNVFVRNMKVLSSTNGFHAQVMGRLFTIYTYGKVLNYAYRCNYGGWMNVGSGSSVSGATNVSIGDGCQVLQGNVSWDSSSSTGSNDNTTTNSSTVTYNATSGDSYKVKYNSWRNDNTVRQGDWSGTGMHKGAWFFGSQFSEIKGKTIESVTLTVQRQSSGGNSSAVLFTLKMHNYSGRPSGSPSFLSNWSKNISLAIGKSTTITITDSAVLTAISNGTMKGFGVEVSNTSNSYYGILTPKLKAVIKYK